VQEQILEQHPAAKLRVYAVWLPMLSTDARSEWSSDLIADARVTHLWDEERVAGRWFADADLGGLGSSGIVWDAFFLFGAEAAWEQTPAPLLRSGAPVVSTTDALAAGIRPLLD
jgi:hypothetical protein